MQEGFKIGEERENKVIILIIIFKAIKIHMQRKFQASHLNSCDLTR